MNGRVLVIGLGLIGGSLALCIKKRHPEATIIGLDINLEQCRLGKMLGVIDEICVNLEEEAVKADLILISTPVIETEKMIEKLCELPLKENVIISDAGSTKEAIVLKARCLKEKNITFIGGHPMAGSHKSGVAAAKEILFENAFYLFTPEPHISQNKVEVLKGWLEGTRAKFITISPEEHDYLTGVISHFPHVIAASLVHQAEQTSRDHQLITRLAAGGFRDITRIASSSPTMWKDISLHNRKVLLSLLDRWKDEMDKFSKILSDNNEEQLFEYFAEAKNFRDDLPAKEKGAIPAFYDLFVDVPDYPGVISEITGYLAKERISITNIRILETREDINGVLVISFQTEADMAKAEECIQRYTNYGTSTGL
ncbi:prephenate dehydrogenase [Robertmurraya korlensis]|uniref:prephenate dehydrogenase n=1 Tax=Robertmurraya korlensis TaxID=519977 RepID=UPI000826211D|nr:prephenate dehydrogenase [Robertmurraya korlensis]